MEMVTPLMMSTNVPSQATTVTTQILPTLIVVLNILVLLVMMGTKLYWHQ